jgi:phage-related protein (TIGR01555 family)
MQILDSLKSLITGLGTDKDKTMSQSFQFRMIQYAELSAMHRSDWLSRKVVDIIPNDMTREWRIWQAEDDQIEKLEELEAKFNVQPKVNQALQTARLYGGAALVMGIKGQDPASELVLDRVKVDSLEYLHVLTSNEIKAGELIKDVTSPYFNEPIWYEVNAANGVQARIHPSRVVRLVGSIILDNRVADSSAWGDSVLQIVYDAINNATSAQQHIAGLIPEAKTDVIYIPGLAEYAATLKGQTALTNRFTYANMAKSMFNMLLLDGTGAAGKAGEGQGEKWEQKQINFAQLPEIMQMFLKVASGAADIPLIRLLQDAPSGLGSNGDSAFKAYYDNIAARQRTELTPAMTRLDEVIIRSALGSRDPKIYYDWAPLWIMTEKERAEIFKLKADAARALVGSSAGEIIPIEAVSDALVNRLVEDGDLPGLEAAIEEYGRLSDQEDDDEQLLAAATQRGLVAPPPKMVRAANDATPRSLYVRRDVLNRAEIQRWAKGQGLTAADDLHVTIVYSETAVDWMKIRPSYADKVEIVGGPRLVEQLGPPDKPVVALLIPVVGDLKWRHEEMLEQGAEDNWPEYVPHITIQKGTAGVDLDAIEPYQGRILLGPEIFEEVKP